LNIAGTSLDSTFARPTNSHLPVLAQKSARQHTNYTKTDIVVDVVARIIVVARGRTAIIRIVVVRTASFFMLVPSLLYFGFWILDFGFWIVYTIL
jgi:hypothetical protein